MSIDNSHANFILRNRIYNNFILRNRIYNLLREWGMASEPAGEPVRLLHKLLRGKDGLFNGSGEDMTAEEVRIMKMLTGEHGHTIYKALLAGKEAS